jgi:urease subunit beta
MQPGEIRFADGPVTINDGRSVTRLRVRNTSSRPVRVSSHFHFYEVNHRLVFERELAYGLHLDLPAGRTVRFGPGEEQEVTLVPYAGARVIQGFNGLAGRRTAGE